MAPVCRCNQAPAKVLANISYRKGCNENDNSSMELFFNKKNRLTFDFSLRFDSTRFRLMKAKMGPKMVYVYLERVCDHFNKRHTYNHSSITDGDSMKWTNGTNLSYFKLQRAVAVSSQSHLVIQRY